MNSLSKTALGFSFYLAMALSGGAAEAPIMATPDHPNGVYQAGETIHWQVKVNAGAVAEGADAAAPLSYVVKKGGLTPVASGTIPLDHGVGTLEATLPEAGTVLVELKGGANGAVKGFAGAVVAPEKLKAGVAAPEDFEAFWQGKLAELEKIPANPVLTPAEGGKDGVQYEKVTLDNISGTHVQGQIARPVTGTKFPAILQVQYAGVYPLQKSWVTEKAAKGWLALNIEAHDLPIDESDAFYQAQSAGPLKNYTMIGSESRETSYFLRMLLGDHRAVEYLASRPDWDGKTLVVIGTSQGGIQSFFTAAYFPKVTGVIVEVPAGCDPGANAAGRAFGWPYWGATKSAKVMETSRYYDAAHFAARVKCPLLVGVGLIDTTSPAGAVYAAFNAAQSATKEIVPMPSADHKTHHEAFSARRELWLKALLQGQSPPVAAEAAHHEDPTPTK